MWRKTPDIFFLVFAADHLQRIEGRKRFQKIVFLLEHSYNVPLQYKFMPYLYGPYCPELQNHIDILVSENILKVEKHNGLFIYEITELGQKISKLTETKIRTEEKQNITGGLRALSPETTENLVKRSKKLMLSITK